jgi:hypothetical protein
MKAFITVYKPVAGWKAVMMWLNEEEDFGPFWEPYETGFFAFATREEAVADAKAWAEAEEIPYMDEGI